MSCFPSYSLYPVLKRGSDRAAWWISGVQPRAIHHTGAHNMIWNNSSIMELFWFPIDLNFLYVLEICRFSPEQKILAIDYDYLNLIPFSILDKPQTEMQLVVNNLKSFSSSCIPNSLFSLLTLSLTLSLAWSQKEKEANKMHNLFACPTSKFPAHTQLLNPLTGQY